MNNLLEEYKELESCGDSVYISVKDITRFFGRSRSSIWRDVKSGVLPVGRKTSGRGTAVWLFNDVKNVYGGFNPPPTKQKTEDLKVQNAILMQKMMSVLEQDELSQYIKFKKMELELLT